MLLEPADWNAGALALCPCLALFSHWPVRRLRVKTIQTRASDEKDPESSANSYPSRCASAKPLTTTSLAGCR